jgi:hypothetical protein
LSRLVAITSRSSASASELVHERAPPFMPVVVLAMTTYGKPVGQYLIEFCDKVLAPVSFAMRNANRRGRFFDGFPVTCAAADGARPPTRRPLEVGARRGPSLHPGPVQRAATPLTRPSGTLRARRGWQRS